MQLFGFVQNLKIKIKIIINCTMCTESTELKNFKPEKSNPRRELYRVKHPQYCHDVHWCSWVRWHFSLVNVFIHLDMYSYKNTCAASVDN